jgi:hypothetical protein
MIRFVHIGDQIYEEYNQFAFYNTVTDKFLAFDGKQVFDSINDFKDYARTSDISKDYIERCLSTIPKTIPLNHGDET